MNAHRRAALAAVVLAALSSVLGACGPKHAHETDARGPYNLVVHNHDGADSVEVFIGSDVFRGDLGSVDPHSTSYCPPPEMDEFSTRARRRRPRRWFRCEQRRRSS